MKLSRTLTLAFLLTVSLISVSAQDGGPPRVPGIDTAGMDRSVRPQDDFFRFVNGASDLMSGLTFRVGDVARVCEAAQAKGHAVSGDSFDLGGVTFHLAA